MATDFISRSEFDRTMQERYCFNCERKGNHPIFGVACKACWVFDMLDEVEQFQSADVRPVVSGKWIVSHDFDSYQLLQCDQCNSMMWNHDKEAPNFCYNCGADMREVEP